MRSHRAPALASRTTRCQTALSRATSRKPQRIIHAPFRARHVVTRAPLARALMGSMLGTSHAFFFSDPLLSVSQSRIPIRAVVPCIRTRRRALVEYRCRVPSAHVPLWKLTARVVVSRTNFHLPLPPPRLAAVFCIVHASLHLESSLLCDRTVPSARIPVLHGIQEGYTG